MLGAAPSPLRPRIIPRAAVPAPELQLALGIPGAAGARGMRDDNQPVHFDVEGDADLLAADLQARI